MDLPLLSRGSNHNPSRCCGVWAPCDKPSEGLVVIGAWTLMTSAIKQHVQSKAVVELQTVGKVPPQTTNFPMQPGGVLVSPDGSVELSAARAASHGWRVDGVVCRPENFHCQTDQVLARPHSTSP